MQRQYMRSHVTTKCPRRKVACQYCHSMVEYQFLENPHAEQCPMFPLPCPNDCGIDDIPRKDIGDHRKTCLLEVVQCSNECGEEMQRQHLSNHLEDQCPRRKIYCQYCHVEGEHQLILGEHVAMCLKFPLACPNECDVGTVCRGDMDEHRQICLLETIDCEYHTVGCEVKMLRKDLDKHTEENMKEHLFLTTKKLNDTENELDRFKERVDTLEIAMHHIINNKSMPESDKTALWPSRLQLTSSIVANTLSEYMTPVIVKMSNFHHLKLHGMKWYSAPFYTHKEGYKMCVVIYPNGCGKGKGTHMSVFLGVMKGLHDDQLPWPLKGEFHIKLLNQISDAEHHSFHIIFDRKKSVARVLSGDIGKSWGTQLFISIEDLTSASQLKRFLNNDSVFIEVCSDVATSSIY